MCGVVAVQDDGFCGFWCLAYLLGMDLPRTLEKVTMELDSCRHLASHARAQGRHPSAEDRAWERLWNIADAKLRCLRYRGYHVDLVSCELQRRGLQDTNCFLTHAELSLLCARMCGSWTPVVEVTPDFHASEETETTPCLLLQLKEYPHWRRCLTTKNRRLKPCERLVGGYMSKASGSSLRSLWPREGPAARRHPASKICGACGH